MNTRSRNCVLAIAAFSVTAVLRGQTPDQDAVKQELAACNCELMSPPQGLRHSPVEKFVYVTGKATDADLDKATPLIQKLLPGTGLSFASGSGITAWRQLAEFPSLRALLIPRSKTLKAEDLAHVGALTKLEVLSLTSCATLDDAAAKQLLGLVALRVLNVEGCEKLGDGALKTFARLPGLQELRCSRSPSITDAGVKELSGLKKLTMLSLRDCAGLTDQAIDAILPISSLRVVDLTRSKGLTGAGMAKLAGLPGLEELELGEVRVSDATLSSLTKATKLKRLVVPFTEITDAGLRHAGKMAQLADLDLYGCKEITDAGLQHIAGLQGLEALLLFRCPKLTNDGVKQLKQALPKCKVSFEESK